ncbi:MULTISPECIES: RSP_7527 family protein [Pseudophaeobacter]|uniref:RSP_7527 family protein n=1 Tax=Pseudophaeobacter TaxID=1541822 RepID=UPI00242C835A|nr:hypothetical protein [Pseudophaeobacter profundi]
MTEHQPVTLTADEIHAIQRRAEAMRARALADGMSAVGRSLRALPQKIVALLQRPRTA